MGTPGYQGNRDILWKPSSQGGWNPGGLSVMLPTSISASGVAVVDKDGNTLERLTKAPGAEVGGKFYSRQYGGSFPSGSRVKIVQADGTTSYITVGDTSSAGLYNAGGGLKEGDYDFNSVSGTSTGSGGTSSSLSPVNVDLSGVDSKFRPGQIGYGYYPAYLGKYFPEAYQTTYKDIESAPYNYVDPIEFAKQYGSFAKSQYAENMGMASDFAMQALDTELKGMQSYVPAAAALQRSQVSLDNIFNQAERTRQISEVMPEQKKFLAAQMQRANAYASGRLPDEQQNTALELGIRSRAADAATAGGFGATSSVAQKSSDLMSAEERFKIAQYGEQLGATNVQNTAALLLAPTEYANAGSQIKVMPTLSGSQLQSQYLQDINQYSMMTAAQANQSVVQQNQFVTSQEQATRQFNAQMDLNNQQFNANNLNNFALTKFSYDVGYAGLVAGAAQTNSNTALGVAQQQMYMDLYKSAMQNAQSANQAGAWANSIGSFITGISGLLGSVGNLFSGSTGTTGTSTSAAYTTPSFNTGSYNTGTTSEYNIGSNYGVDTSSSGSAVTDATSSSNAPFVSGNTPDFSIPSAGYSLFSASTANQTLSSSSSSDSTVNAKKLKLSSSSDSTGTTSTDTSATTEGGSSGTGGAGGYGNLDSETIAQAKTLTDDMFAAAGVGKVQQADTVLSGVNANGDQIYSNKTLALSDDTTVGSKSVQASKDFLNTLFFAGRESEKNTVKGNATFDGIIAAAQDTTLMAQLTDALAKGDTSSFVNMLVNRLGYGVASAVYPNTDGKKWEDMTQAERTSVQENRNGVLAAIQAGQLAVNWNNMSGAQRSIAIARIGMNGWDYIAHGENSIWKTPINSTSTSSNPLTYGQAFNLAVAGYDVYKLLDNWDQYDTAGKVLGSASTGLEVAAVAKDTGLLRADGSVAKAIESIYNGAKQVGSSIISSLIPEFGQTAATQGTSAFAGAAGTQAAGGSAAQSALATQGSNIIGNAAGGLAIGSAGYNIIKNWGNENIQNAVLNGGSIALGLSQMGGAATAGGASSAGYLNPYTAAAVMAVSAFTLGNKSSGKGESQVARDIVRTNIQNTPLLDKDYQVTLADGSKFDLGIDGSGGVHIPANPDKLVAEHEYKKSFRSYEVDYTNDLDYATSQSTIALSRILNGGKERAVDQLGGQLANAALSSVGYGKEMTAANYAAAMKNVRAFYSQAGVKSKNEALAYASKLYKDNRINDIDYVASVKGINQAFDPDGYQKAKSGISGRFAGIKEATGYAERSDEKLARLDTKKTETLKKAIPNFSSMDSEQKRQAREDYSEAGETDGASFFTTSKKPRISLTNSRTQEQAASTETSKLPSTMYLKNKSKRIKLTSNDEVSGWY